MAETSHEFDPTVLVLTRVDTARCCFPHKTSFFVTFCLSDTHRHLSVGAPCNWVHNGSSGRDGPTPRLAILLHGVEPDDGEEYGFPDSRRTGHVRCAVSTCGVDAAFLLGRLISGSWSGGVV
jgi:hypothetical protein